MRIIISFESKPSTENLFIPSDDGENVRSSAMLKSCIFSSQLLLPMLCDFHVIFVADFVSKSIVFSVRERIFERELIADFGSQIL